MGLIAVKEANCKNCYRCLRGCMVKSLKYKGNKMDVIEDQCILCGNCIVTCEQKAKILVNDEARIRRMVGDPDTRTVVSLAPSFIAAYGQDNRNRLVGALKKLGFSFVEETSIGASEVTRAYRDLIEEGKMRNILSSCCPTVNMLIAKYFPDLLGELAPVITPAETHARMIKKHYGEDTKVIFIGPCLSKIHEADESDYLDGALSFGELNAWFEERGIRVEDSEVMDFDKHSGYSRIYPIENGILYDLKQKDAKNTFDYLAVSGLENVKALLEEMQAGKIEKAFVEVNACTGGCVNGPLMPGGRQSFHRGRIQVDKYARHPIGEDVPVKVDMACHHKEETVEANIPGEATIRAILSQIGKPTPEQELNCGSCGYPTCRDKAIAVYQGKAELHMCMPYMFDMSQTLANVTLSVTPNYIVAVDEDMKIKECNLSAQALFNVTRNEALQKYIFDFIDHSDFIQVMDEKRNLYDKKVSFENLGITVNETIIYVDDQNIAIGILQDITAEEKAEQKQYDLKMETVEMAQKVIDKQMVVAQEIASLLGETTAETKVTLNKLKDLIADGNEK